MQGRGSEGIGWLPALPDSEDNMAYEEVERSLDPEEFFRTNDMSMATYLKVKGHVHQAVEWKSGTCFWIFRASDLLLDEVDRFLGGDALIEPKEYNRVFTQTKREFYDSKPDERRLPTRQV